MNFWATSYFFDAFEADLYCFGGKLTPLDMVVGFRPLVSFLSCSLVIFLSPYPLPCLVTGMLDTSPKWGCSAIVDTLFCLLSYLIDRSGVGDLLARSAGADVLFSDSEFMSILVPFFLLGYSFLSFSFSFDSSLLVGLLASSL